MKHFIMFSSLCMGLYAGSAPAQDIWKELLPPSEITQPILLDSPVVQSARFKKQAQQSRAQAQALGPHEFSARLQQQARRVSQPNESFAETIVSLERPVRWWGKAEIDQQLAQQSRQLAQITYADALHEASRQLLGHWFSAVRAQVKHASALNDWALAQSMQRQASRRWKQGDISQLDAQLAEAELQRTQAHKDLSDSELKRTLALLSRLYPGLPAPGPLPSLEWLPEMEPLPVLRTEFLAKHHELNLWRAEAARAEVQSRRADKERMPDPTLGVFTARERMGAERIVGVSVAIPWSGQARQQQAEASRFDAQAAQDKVRQLELEFGADFDQRWTLAQDLRQAVAGLSAALNIQQQAAEKSLRAYSLGEGTMTEVIQHRRLANEQQTKLRLLQLDIVEHQAFIRLDLHQLWDFD
jgi:cobalt-zinc-cadmium efflux system outer membrane protein